MCTCLRVYGLQSDVQWRILHFAKRCVFNDSAVKEHEALTEFVKVRSGYVPVQHWLSRVLDGELARGRALYLRRHDFLEEVEARMLRPHVEAELIQDSDGWPRTLLTWLIVRSPKHR